MFELMTEDHLPAVMTIALHRFDPPLTETMVRTCMGRSLAWVAVEGGVRGFYLLAPQVTPTVRRILALAAAEDGDGWGRRLGEHVVAQAQAQGVKRLTCEVAQGNTRAQRMYQRFGAVVTGVRPNYYTLQDGVPDDAMTYTLYL